MRDSKNKFSSILAILMFTALAVPAIAQSPKKYLKNGYYEQAFVEAVYKQNKKVKLKEKHTEVIYESYKKIYASHGEDITSSLTTWEQSYNRLIRMTQFRAKVKHPGVYDNLKNMFYDEVMLDHLAMKFNNENLKDSDIAGGFESTGKFKKALEVYQGMAKRHEQATPITTMKDKLLLIDCEAKIEFAKGKIGDQLIQEARHLLEAGSKKDAQTAIKRINEAKSYRPLDAEEEELITLANLIIGESWMTEAQNLLNTPTKKNARLAYELINRTRTVRTLTAEEERLLEKAEDLGMTRILVAVAGKNPIHSSEALSGILNKKKSSSWISYFYNEDIEPIDFKMEVSESKPTVVLGNVQKQVKQHTKSVDYWVEEKDASGNIVKVKKTRLAVAMVAILSRTKTAKTNWTVTVKDFSNGKVEHSESRESKHEIKHEYASVESGDALALPENIESEIELDSQPFPEDEAMLRQAKELYIHELLMLLKEQKDHLRNINQVIER